MLIWCYVKLSVQASFKKMRGGRPMLTAILKSSSHITALSAGTFQRLWIFECRPFCMRRAADKKFVTVILRLWHPYILQVRFQQVVSSMHCSSNKPTVSCERPKKWKSVSIDDAMMSRVRKHLSRRKNTASVAYIRNTVTASRTGCVLKENSFWGRSRNGTESMT